MESYTIRTRNGKLDGPYNIRVIRAYVIAGRLHKDDILITPDGDIPIAEHRALQTLLERHSGSKSTQQSPNSNSSPPQPSSPPGRVVFLQGKLLPPGPNPDFAGSLVKHPLIYLVYRFSLSEMTGRLHLRSNRETVDIFFERGRPTYSVSNLPGTKLGEILLKNHLINQEQHKQVVRRCITERRALGQILLEEKYISSGAIKEALLEQFKMRFFTALGWKNNAVYRFYQNQISGAQFPIDISSWELLKEGALKRMPLARIEDQLLPYRNSLVVRQIHPRLELDVFAFSPQEQEFIKSITQQDPINDVVGDAIERNLMTEEAANRLLYLVWQMQFLRMGEERIGARTQRQLKNLKEFIRALKNKSRLQRLDLKGGATPSEIRHRYLNLAKKYHPDHLPPGTHPDVAEQMSEAFALIAEAYQILSD